MRAEIDAGVRFALSSDADVTSFVPLETITNAVLGTTMGGRSIGSDQALTVEEAIRAHTGKRADLTIIDGKLFEVAPAAIRDLSIWMTIVDGDVLYGPGGRLE
jgi:predicted amidohydrolase YtcJ